MTASDPDPVCSAASLGEQQPSRAVGEHADTASAAIDEPDRRAENDNGPTVEQRLETNLRAAFWGIVVNLVLVAIKLAAGILGNSYALVADAIESSTDVVSSLVVWTGLQITARPADEEHPYGYGRAEGLTIAIVALMLLGAALAIMLAAVREILTPHHAPAAFTLGVLAAVVLVKETLFRRVLSVAETTTSGAVEADAWHHRSDAITSAAAFVGIAIALWGGPGWEAADDWAALVAAAVIGWNGVRLLKQAVAALMDRQPDARFLEQIADVARSVPGVLAIEKLRVRKSAEMWFADLHVQADPALSLDAAHQLSGRVKAAIRGTIPAVRDVLIHMEPYHPV